ncbi:unnamed protein product, partial [marine sediment metagenome]
MNITFWMSGLFVLLCCGTGGAQEKQSDGAIDIVRSARTQIGKTLEYNPAYVSLDYPNGDLPIRRGVCTDVVIRA